MTLEKLQVIIEAYTKPYQEEMEKVKQQTTAATNHVERQTAKMKHSFGKIAGMVAAVFSVAAIVAFGKSCIELGSDLAEVQNVVDVTFGDMSRQVDAFAKNAITTFGLSELTAKKYMGTYGAMAKSFGYVGEAGYQMSAAITGLTGDVASFYNLSTDEAYTKLKSIFTGETESLKELGVVMTQTALDQYALNNGFGKTTAKMTEQEKVMLRYQFVMSSLSDAQGDFARTSSSWANQVRILSLQFDSLKATIGQGLINAFTPVIRVINTILAKLQTLANYFKAFTTALFGDAGGSDAVSGAADSMASAAGSSGAVADNMDKAAGAAKKMKEYTLGIDELNVLNPDDGGGGSGGSGGGGGGSPDFGSLGGELFGDVTVNPEIEAATARIKDAVEKLKEAAKPTTDALKRLWDEGLSLLGTFTWTALQDFWNYFLVPLGKWTLGKGLPRFIDITNKFLKAVDWEAINVALKEFWKALEPFAESVGEGLLDFYEDLAEFGANFINKVVPGGIQGLADALSGIDADKARDIGYALGLVGTALVGLKIAGGAAAGIKALGDAIKGFPGVSIIASLFSGEGLLAGLSTLATSLGGPGTPAFDVIGNIIIDGISNYIREHFGEKVLDAISGSLFVITFGGLGAVIGGPIGAVAAVIFAALINDISSWDAGEFWSTLCAKLFNYDTVSAIWDQAGEFFKSAGKAFEAGNFIEFGENIIAGIASGLTAGLGLLVEPIADLFEWVWKAICKVFGIASPAKEMKPIGEYILFGIIEGFRNTFSEWTKALKEWFDKYITPWFTTQKWSDLYSTIKEELKNAWDKAVEWWHNNVTAWWNRNVSPWFTVTRWKQLYESIKTQLRQKWKETAGEWQNNLTSWWDNDVSPWFTIERWISLYESIKTQLKQTWDATAGQWGEDLTSWWGNDVSPWFTVEKWLGIYESIKSSLKTTWDNTVGQWKIDIDSWWKEHVSAWFTKDKWTEMMNKVPSAFAETFKGAVDAARKQINNLIDWVNDHLKFEWDDFEIGGKTLFEGGSIQLFTIPHIPAFADGGIINSGQLFVANEAGPELVGKYGNKAGVVNNKQIVDAVSEGVAVAVANVMTSFSGQGQTEHAIELTVNLDGRTVSKGIYKADRRGGFKFRPV